MYLLPLPALPLFPLLGNYVSPFLTILPHSSVQVNMFYLFWSDIIWTSFLILGHFYQCYFRKGQILILSLTPWPWHGRVNDLCLVNGGWSGWRKEAGQSELAAWGPMSGGVSALQGNTLPRPLLCHGPGCKSGNVASLGFFQAYLFL